VQVTVTMANGVEEQLWPIDIFGAASNALVICSWLEGAFDGWLGFRKTMNVNGRSPYLHVSTI
jgi:hypothetical protein